MIVPVLKDWVARKSGGRILAGRIKRFRWIRVKGTDVIRLVDRRGSPGFWSGPMGRKE